MLRLALRFTLWIILAAHLAATMVSFAHAPKRTAPPVVMKGTIWRFHACDDYQTDRTGCGLTKVDTEMTVGGY